MHRLENKTVLVTGGARGIGKAIAELFAIEGASVIVSDIRDDMGKEVAASLDGKAIYIHLDVSKEEDWITASARIKDDYKGLDVLVNNAGIAGILESEGPHDPENLNMESWHKIHATNLDGVALGCKYGIRLMKDSSSASIVNISSRSGIIGVPFVTAYASSKAAVRNHTKSVALYCAAKKLPIRCNSIHPGAIYTPIWDVMLGAGEQKETAIKAVSSEIPLGVMGTPEDVAYGALYLASDEARYVTGIELNIDGGILAGSAALPPSNE